jgi:flagellar hook-associated protein 3 FlgL
MSLYRVSTANTYDRALLNIQQRQTQVGTAQEQLSSGKRVLKASDDAVAATLSERTQNRLARTAADLRGLEASRRSLQQAESTLSSVGDVYTRIKELVVQAGSGVVNDSDKRSIATELKGLREQLVGFSNQKDTAGKPLFAGLGPQNANGQAFVEQLTTPAATTYGADGKAVAWDGQRGQVAATETTLPAVLDGYGVFKGSFPDKAGAIVATNSGAFEAVTVTATTPNADVFDLSPDATPVTQGNYAIAYTAATDTWQVTQTNRTNTPLPAAAAPAPFAVVPTVVGDAVELTFDGMTVKLRTNGAAPFATDASFTVTPAVDRDIWESLDRAIGALEGGESGDALTQELAVVHDQLGARQDQLLNARGKLGDWLNRADSMKALFDERSVAYEKENSDLVDVDMVKAISDFQKNQTAYQAALQSYAQVQKMSMFDYLR